MGAGASYEDEDDYIYQQRYHHHQYRQQVMVPTHQHHHHVQPAPQKVPMILVMYNDLAMQKDSLKLIPSKKNPSHHTITFTFDSFFECMVTVYFLVQEKVDPVEDITHSFSALIAGTPEPKSINFPAGASKKFDADELTFNLAAFPHNVVYSKADHQYGLVIRMEKRDPKKEDAKVIYNYCEFEEEKKSTEVKVKRQKMEINGQSFEIQEIYGIDAADLTSKGNIATIEDTNKECAVCLSDKIDTIVLPCRHMCLCVGCAQELSKKSAGQKCPICREGIDNFVRLTRGQTQATTPSLPGQPQPSGPPPKR